MFDLDQEENSNTQNSQTQRVLRRGLQNQQNSAYNGIIGKGFISSSHSHAPFFEQITNNTQSPNRRIIQKESLESSPRRKKKEKTIPVLQPMSQTMSTIVYSHQTPSVGIVREGLSRSEPPLSLIQPVTQVKVNNFTLSANNTRIIFHQDTDEQQNQPQDKQSQSIKILQGISKSNLLFELESNYETIKTVEMQKEKEEELFINLPQARKTNIFSFSDSSDQQQQETSPVQQKIISSKDMLINLALNKKWMCADLPQANTLQMVLLRNKEGFNSFWPEFYLQFAKENKTFLAAKKVSSKPASTFIISSNINFTENSSFYLGKLKANIFGDVINLFGVGFNPCDAKDRNCIPRELLATIVFTKTAMNKPREFQVYIRKPQYRYYLNFHQVVMYGEEVPLSQLYTFPENKSKIEKYCNRKPTLNRQEGMYTLNFGGKAQCRSIKNFILESQSGNEAIVFGKVTDEKFNLLISHPLSAIVGMAVALTSFDNRLLFSE